MKQPQKIKLPLQPAEITKLRAGDLVLLSGPLYTARDAVHKRFCQLLQRGRKIPLELRGQTLFYAGPCPAPKGRIIGSIGPTTSGRIDAFTPLLLEKAGVKTMIGKGRRSPEVISAIKKRGAVYFAATGGAAALLAGCVRSSKTVLYPELGAEAVMRLEVRDLPAVVAVDAKGRSIYPPADKIKDKKWAIRI